MRHDLTKDKPPSHPPGWVGIDSRQVLSSSDLELVGRLTEMSRELDQLVRRLPAVLHMMRDAQAGQPPSALSNLGNDPDAPPARLWCWDHERYTTECDADGLVCKGEIRVGPTDRVGEAAMTRDQAELHHRMLAGDAERLVKTFARMLGTAAGYPTDVLELPDVEASPGEDWCRCCWKDNKHCEPITLRRATGRPYYRGLCRWCGDQSKVLGGEPPVWLVAKRHRGERITPGDMDRARKEARGRKKGKRK